MGMRKLVGAMLKKLGYDEVLEAKHGGEAWSILRAQSVDLLLTDWNMPIMSGLELVEKVRQNPAYDQLPILMFTARAAKEDVIAAVKSGVDGYIAKPFTPQQLEAKLRAIVGRRQQNQIGQILRGKDTLDRHEEHTLVLFGEEANTLEQLAKPDKYYIVRFLSQAMISYNLLKGRFPEAKVGYGIESSSNIITKRLRVLGNRIKLLMLSTRLQGGGVTLARLASINSRSGMKVMVLCDNISELSSKERFGLDRLGISLIERHKLKSEELEQLINEFAFTPARQGLRGELPPPEEIRRRLDNDIRNMVKLPVLPGVYHRIVSLDHDRDSDIQEWIKAINLDPLCQAQVIRRARSPIYGFRGEITDVGKAVILMGKNAVKELVVSGALQRSFEEVDKEQVPVEDFWLHSVATALAARILSCPLDPTRQSPDQRRELEELALPPEAIDALKRFNIYDRLRLSAGQDPFIGGMMHDIGKIALAHAYPGIFSLFVEHLQVQNWNSTMLSAEEMVAGGAQHCHVGRILADSWQLGEETTRVIQSHHAPAADDRFSQLIGLANFVAGGIYPYPLTAAYPLVRLLPGLTAAKAPAAAAPPPPPVAEGAAAGAAAVADEALPYPVGAQEALAQFLPTGLVEALVVQPDELVELAKLLAPTIRKFTEDMRKNLSTGKGS
ncbi:MAG: HDOD domain-containing protein [Candidatus Latescibacteria bacterium]|nr:HDOD domain-containing protein [Candidatus Latescibacterota bacterium]